MNVKIILIISLLFVLFSCSDEKELYSCDPNIDSWVKENIEEIQCMTRCEWQELDEELKSATYTAFLPEQKISFWQDKFDELKELPWSDRELEHIGLAEQFLNEHKDLFYEEHLNDEQYDEINVFFYKWSKYAMEELHWENRLTAAILMSGDKVINVQGDVEKREIGQTKSTNMLTSSVEPTCNCSSEVLFPCGVNNDSECSLKKKCNLASRSCGFLLLFDCDGRCDPL